MDRLHHARNPLILFFGITCLIALSAYVNVISPDSLVTIIGFFLLLGLSIGFLGFYALRKRRHALLLSFGVCLYLVLRFVGLKHPLYAVLLVASVIALEYLWKENQ